MYDRLGDFPVLDSYLSRIPARVWNLWLRYRRHTECETGFSLEELPGLSLILSDKHWVVTDSSLNEAPVLAWSDFQAGGRTAIHLPVVCKIRHYHQGAAVARDKTLELMVNELETRLRRE